MAQSRLPLLTVQPRGSRMRFLEGLLTPSAPPILFQQIISALYPEKALQLLPMVSMQFLIMNTLHPVSWFGRQTWRIHVLANIQSFIRLLKKAQSLSLLILEGPLLHGKRICGCSPDQVQTWLLLLDSSMS